MGILIPRINYNNRPTVSLTEGLLIYVTSNGPSGNGFYYYDGDSWALLSTGVDSDWTISGNDMYNNNSGNIGIGTNSPGTKLHICTAGTNETAFLEIGSISDGGSHATSGLIKLSHDHDDVAGNWTWKTWTIGVGDQTNFGLYDNFGIRQSNPSTPARFVIVGSGANAGNVGIGVIDPDAKLEINGQIKITGGSPDAGKVLTSDGTGLATWETSAGGSSDAILSSNLHTSYDDISGWTSVLSGQVDDGAYNIPFGFNFTIDGTDYINAYISTNGVLHFTSSVDSYSNGTLPNSAFSNPTICFHWDDNSAHSIEYQVTGDAPNRICQILWKGNETTSGSTDNIIVLIVLSEFSNLATINYLDINFAAEARGSSATIGAQGAGGSSATAYPISINTAILDDNTTPQSWSIDW